MAKPKINAPVLVAISTVGRHRLPGHLSHRSSSTEEVRVENLSRYECVRLACHFAGRGVAVIKPRPDETLGGRERRPHRPRMKAYSDDASYTAGVGPVVATAQWQLSLRLYRHAVPDLLVVVDC